jgi:hypothetical protein
MKALTMSDLRKRGDVPLSPRQRHQRDTGSGSYNRFSLLQPPSPRPRLGSKRKLDQTPAVEAKTPKLDPNIVFGQLKEVEDNLVLVKSTVSAVMAAGDSVFNIAEGGLGAAVHKLALAIDMLICNQEKLLSAVVDSANMGGNRKASSFVDVVAGGGTGELRKARMSRPSVSKPPPSAEALREKKIRQAIIKAEKSTVIFNADLGGVPVMNRDTLARKVTLLLHDKARTEGEYSDNQKAAEEAVDDFLSCATLDFLGKGTQSFYNKKNTEDERNRKFCTVPIKLTWKSKGERIRGEQSIRKVCNSKCSVSYPRKIRALIDKVLKAGQSAKPGCYISVRVSHESLTVIAHAREGNSWTDLGISKVIPSDILEPVELANLADERGRHGGSLLTHFPPMGRYTVPPFTRDFGPPRH